MQKLRSWLVLFAMGWLSCEVSANQIIYVKQNAAAGPATNGTSWANAFRELRDALPAATNASTANRVEIWVATGTYRPTATSDRFATFALPSYVAIRGGFAGTESSPGQRPVSGAWTVLSGDIWSPDTNGITATNIGAILAGTAPAPAVNFTNVSPGFSDNSYNVLRCVGGNDVLLDNLVITGGNANNLRADGSRYFSDLDLEDMLELNLGTDAHPELNGTPVISPHLVATGGGIFVTNVHARPATQMTLTLSNCVFMHNHAANFGGALAAFEANLSATGCAFVNNGAIWEGGAFTTLNSFSSFDGCGFTNNASVAAAGAFSFTTLPSLKNVRSEILSEQKKAAIFKTAAVGVKTAVTAGKLVYDVYGLVDAGSLHQLAKPAILQSESLTTDLATDGLSSAYAAVGVAFTLGTFITDLEVTLGADPNSPRIKNWRAANAFFNQYLTPLGILSMLSEATGGQLGSLLHQPSPQDLQNDYMRRQLENFNGAPYSKLRDCSFVNNRTEGTGGAGTVHYDNVEFNRCRFLNNNAGALAGGLALVGWNTPRVLYCAFSGNTSQHGCSALLCSFHVNAQILHSTFVNNASVHGGSALSVELGSAVKLFNSVLWGNASTNQTDAAAQLKVVTRQMLSAEAQAAYDLAGPFKSDYVATLDLRMSTVQGFDQLPQGTEQYLLFPYNADSFLISISQQYFQQADDKGFADLAGYVNLGEGIRPRAFLVDQGSNRERNNGVNPKLIGPEGIVPLANSPVRGQASANYWGYNVAFAPLPALQLGSHYEGGGLEGFFDGVDTFAAVFQSGFTDIFGAQSAPNGRDRGCVQFQGYAQAGLDKMAFRVRAGASADGDGQSWATAFPDFGPLLAGEFPGNTQIWVGPGQYTNTGVVPPGLCFYGGFTGNETNLSQRNWTNSQSRFSGGLQCFGGITLDGLVITNSQRSGFPAVYGSSGTALLNNSVFANNSATYAGAVYWDGVLIASNSQFTGNSALTGGGALHGANITVLNCRFRDNSTSFRGGAIFGGSSITAIGSIFSGNQAGSGGAIAGNGAPNTWQLYNDTFYGNGPAAVLITGSYDPRFPLLGVFGPAPVPVNCLFWGNVSDGVVAQAYDPLFLNPPAQNFELSALSAAIGGGTTNGLPPSFPATDLAGKPRLTNGRLDMGALQFQATTGLNTQIGLNGANQIFTVLPGTNGVPLSLQWQIFTNGAWVNLVGNPTYVGVNTLQLTVANPSAALYGSQYRINGIAANGQPFQTEPVGLVKSTPSSLLYVRQGATGTGDGSSWANAFPNMQTLFDFAGDAPVQVWVAKGTYTGTGQANAGIQLFGGFAGNETDMTQRDWRTNQTLFTGEIRCRGNITMDGFVITNCNNPTGLAAISSSFTGYSANIANCKFANNSGGAFGGIYWFGSLTVSNAQFIANRGAIYANQLTALNCLFAGNSNNVAYHGAAIECNSGFVEAINCVFATNTAPQGSAIYGGSMPPSAWRLVNNTFYGNGPATIVISGSFNPNSPLLGVFGPAPVPVNCLFAGNVSDGVPAQSFPGLPSAPLFLNPLAGNFELSSNSPAIGAATTNGLPASFPAEDLAGKPRFTNGRLDMGALQFRPTNGFSTEISLSGLDTLFTVRLGTNTAANALQWQLFTNGVWTALANGSTYLGVTTLQLTVKGSTPPPFGGQYRLSGTAAGGVPFQTAPVAYLNPAPSGIVYVRQGATGTGDGSSWQNAFTNLQSLFTVAGDAPIQVWVAKGTYTGTGQANAGIQLYGGFTGNEISVSQRQLAANPTLFTGSLNPRGNFLMDGFIVTNSVNTTFGAAIYSTLATATATFNQCVFVNNTNTLAGAIYWLGPLNVTNAQFLGNAGGSSGGAIFAHRATVLNSFFRQNHATTSGGAIYAQDYLKAIHCVFTGNTAPTGSALYGLGEWQVYNDTFYGNGPLTVTDGNGPTPVPINCLFWQNTSDGVTGQTFPGYDADPFFVNAAATNFQLNAYSLAIGAGTTNGLPTDFPTTDAAGNPRTVSGRMDLGAYQFQGVPVPPPFFTIQKSAGYVGGFFGPYYSFTLVPGTNPAPASVQWQVSSGNGVWTNLTNGAAAQGVTGLQLSLYNPGSALNGFQYRATGTAANGAVFALAPAALQLQNFTNSYAVTQTVRGGLSSSGQWGPLYSLTAALGTNGNGATFQWQVNTGNGVWLDLTNGPLYQGVTTLDLTVVNPPAAFSGYQFRLTGVAAPGAFIVAPVAIQPNFPRAIYVDGTRGYPYYTNWVATHTNAPAYDGLGWATAFPTLHEAVATAQPGAEIWVRSGTYYPLRRLLPNGQALPSALSLPRSVRVLGGFVGTETNSVQRNFTNNLTVVSGVVNAPGDDANLSGYEYVPSPSLFVNGTNVASDSVLDGFTLTGATGGAMVNFGGSPLLQNCRFVTNSALNGSAMASWSNASPTLVNCVISANVGNQGTLYFNNASGSLQNCLVSGNRTFVEGGGIFATNSTVAVRSSAVVFNAAAGVAGGLWSGGGSNAVVNSILWGNTGAQAAGLTSLAYSCVQGGGTTNHNLAVDPIFVSPVSNDFRLSLFSPLLNIGDAVAATNLSVDLGGNARASGGLVDIGPYQHQLAPATPLSITSLPAALTVSNYGTYSFTVAGMPTSFTNLQWQVSTGSVFTAVVNTALLNYSVFTNSTSASLFLYFTNTTTSAAAYDTMNGALYRFIVPGLNFTSAPTLLSVKIPVTLLVNSQAPGPVRDGLTWATAFTNLSSAFAASTNPLQLWVARGTYNLPASPALENAALYGGFFGTETNLAQRDWNTNLSILTPTNVNLSGTLHGFRIQGSAQVASSLVLRQASPLVQYCTFTGGSNQVTLDLGQPTFDRCTFSDATGGVRVVAGQANLLSCTFGPQLATAITAGPGQTMVSNSTFTGASVGLLVSGTEAAAFVSRSVFSNNLAACIQDGPGGAATVRNSLFVSNNCNVIVHAGAQRATMTVLNSTFVNNRPPQGVITATGANGTDGLTVRNSVLWHNYSTGWSNYVTANPSIFTGPVTEAFANSDVNEIYTDASFSYNVLAAQALAAANLGLTNDAAGYLAQAQNYKVQAAALGTVANSAVEGLSLFTGRGNIPSDPLFVSPATGNFVPGPYSPVQDAGDAAYANAADRDLNANPRIFGAAPDMGAYEIQSASPAVIAVEQSPQSLSLTTPGTAAFTAVVATNSALTNFVWQKNSGSGWTAVATNQTFTITDTANTTVLRINPLDLTLNGYQFRLAALPIAYATAPALLTVGLPPLIGTAGQTIGTTAVLPLGTNATAYVWQRKIGADWITLTNGPAYTITYATNSSALTVLSLQASLNGEYRFAATNGSFASTSVTLSIFVSPILYVRPGATGNGLGTNWAGAFTRLTDAVNAAASGQQIWVAGGTYPATNTAWQIPQGVAVYGGFNGSETSLSQRGSANASVLVAQSNASIFNLTGNPSGPVSVLDGFVLQGGVGQPALTSTDSRAAVRNCTFTNNLASAVSNANASMTFSNCLFIHNRSTNGGGAIVAVGGTNTMLGCQFLTNRTEGNGGAAFASSARFNLAQCTFRGNTAGAGGGALAFSGPAAYASMTLSTFSGNAAANGGAIFGGQTLNSGEMVSCLVAGNYATNQGGGIDWEQNAYSSLRLINCTVANNASGGNGAGLWTARDVNIHNTILWNNRSAAGGSLEFQQFYNTNFLDRLAAYEILPITVPYFLNADYSIIEGLDIYNRTQPGSHGLYVLSVADNSPLDPEFVNPAAGDFQLRTTSPALNTGSNYWIITSSSQFADAAANPRTFGGTVDRGAYELQADPAPPLFGPTFPVTQSVCNGAKVSFTCAATNAFNISSLVWQIGNGSAFTDLNSAGIYTISTTSTQTVLTVNPATTALSGTQFRLRVKGYAYTTPAATLWVSAPTVAYVNPAATGNGSGTTWANAFTNLQDALNGTDCVQLWVARGTYVLPTGTNGTTSFRLRESLDLRGGFVGTETNLAQRNFTLNPTILRATNGQSIFLNDGTAGKIDQTAILDGFVLSGATVNPAIYNLNASPVIRNCVFTNNQARAVLSVGTAPGFGGSFSNCVFIDNTGGGIQLRFTSPGITNCTFTRNRSTGFGAGIDNEQGSPRIIGCSFTQNTAVRGAAFYNNTTNAGTVLAASSLRDNAAPEGGAVYNTYGSALALRDALFAQNNASAQGGAIFNAGALTLTHGTLSDNAAGYSAGGLWLEAGGTLAAGNSIFWNNTINSQSAPTLAAQLDGTVSAEALGSVSSSIVQGLTGTPANNNLPYNPFFVDGSAGDYHLTAVSPALNAGNLALLLPGETDLEGQPRWAGAGLDLGAYEFQGVASAPLTLLLLPQSVTTCASNEVVFRIAAPTNAALTYTWQQQNGNVFTPLGSNGVYAITAANGTGTLKIANVPAELNGTVYRVLITGPSVSATTPVFTLGVSTRSVIYVNRLAAPGGNGSTWNLAFTNLADALRQGSCSDIWMAAGTYSPTNSVTGAPSRFQLAQSQRLFGGFAGTETNLAQRNPAAHPTLLRGAQGTTVLQALGGGSPIDGATVLDGLTFTGSSNDPALLLSGAGPVIRNCVFTGNAAGAVVNQGGAAPVFISCLFSNNVGASAVLAQNAAPTFAGCVFTRNQTLSGESGGAVRATTGSTVSFAQCVFSNNVAVSDGGAIFADASSVSLVNSLLVSNTAAAGGAIRGNEAALSLVNATVAQNAASVSGGVLISGSATILNSILWNNGASEAAQISGDATVAYSCVQGLNLFAGNNNLALDPQFVNPAAGSYLLQATSPCIDNGVRDALVPAFDLAGNPRVRGYTVDIGAYESAGLGTYFQVTQSPVSQLGCAGGSVSFTAAGPAGFGDDLVWQVNSGSGFQTVTLGGNYTVTTNDTVSQLTISGLNLGLSGQQFRVEISNLGIYSGTALLTVRTPGTLYVNAAANGNSTGTNWAGAFNNLDAALAVATACDQVWVAAGTYTSTRAAGGSGFVSAAGTTVLGGFAGSETNAAQRDWSSHATILTSATHTNVLQFLAGGVLDGFAVTAAPGVVGLSVGPASPVIQNCTFSSLTAGAILVSGGSPLMQNCLFVSNTFSAFITQGNGSPVLSSCVFTGNRSAGPGGAVLNRGSGLTVQRSTFSGNGATLGGALGNLANGPAVVVDHCVFNANAATSAGGAIYNGSGAHLAVLNSLLYGNSAINGGGIENRAEMSLLSSTLSGNRAVYAGGACHGPQGSGAITNSILWANSPAELAGALTVSSSLVQGITNGTDGSFSFDPQFANPSAGDFHLMWYSPAISAGAVAAAAGIATDLDQNPRLSEWGLDLGAYQSAETPHGTVYVTAEPVSQTLCAGETTVQFSIAAGESFNAGWILLNDSGATTLSDGMFGTSGEQYSIAGSTLTIYNVNPYMDGNRFQVMDNNDGGFLSPPATLTFLPPAGPLYVNAAAAPGGDGASWGSAFQDLTAALNAANPCQNAIWVAGGTYAPVAPNVSFVIPSLPGGVKIYGGFAGTEANLAERNVAAYPTILSGTGGAADATVTFDGRQGVIGTNTVLNGLTITGGGAGVTSAFASPMMVNCTIVSNSAGGVKISGGSPHFENARILGNSAVTGGGLYLAGNEAPCAASFQACTFQGNGATVGTAVYALNATPLLENCLVSGQTGTALVFSNSPATIIHSTVAGNHAGLASAGATVQVKNSLFWHNGSGGTNAEQTQLAGNVSVASSGVQGLAAHAGNGNQGFDPLFVAPLSSASAPTQSGNYHLRASSPALGVGNLAFVATASDLDGNLRPGGNGTVDLGAYEFVGIALIPLKVSDLPPVVYGEPGTNLAIPASAIGTGLLYQWQVNAGSGWITLTNGSVYGNVTTSNLTILQVTQNLRNALYRVLVSDANGATATSSSARVAIRTPQVSGVTLLPNREFRLTLVGSAGSYTVWWSSDLMHWEELGSASPQGNDTFQFTDTSAPAAAVRFYQIRTP